MTIEYISIIIKIVLAVILGGVIGFERESKHRPAGFRTHVLVCVGSALVIMVSEYVFIKFYNQYGSTLDPTRMGAQVISGIGFLGAGTIMHYGANVRGLTTAASIWAVACVGLAVGSGAYFLAISTTIVIFITLVSFSKLTTKMEYATGYVSDIIIHMRDDEETLGNVMYYLTRHNAKLMSIDLIREDSFSDTEETAKYMMKIYTGTDMSIKPIINSLSELEGVSMVEIV